MNIANRHRVKFLLFISMLMATFYVWHELKNIGGGIFLGMLDLFLFQYMVLLEDTCKKCGRQPSSCSDIRRVNPFTYMLINGRCPCCKE